MVTYDEAELIEITILKLKAIRSRLRKRARFISRSHTDPKLRAELAHRVQRISLICTRIESIAGEPE